jgi:hypothetical protein
MKIFKLYILLTIVSASACNYSKIDGTLGVSKDIQNSKHRSVFIREYTVVNNPYVINDSLHLLVKSAWIEHQWRYDGFNGKKSKKENKGWQIIIITDETSLKGYGKNWMIGLTGKNSFRLASRDALIIDLDSLPQKKSLIWQVQDSNKLAPLAEKIIIGKFALKEK